MQSWTLAMFFGGGVAGGGGEWRGCQGTLVNLV